MYLLHGNMRWLGYVGATYFCVIRSAPLQQLQLVAGGEDKNSHGQGHFCTWGGLPGLLLSRHGPVHFCFRQGQPKGRWAKWDARLPSGRAACPSFLLLLSLVVQLAKKAIAASLPTQTPLTVWSKAACLFFLEQWSSTSLGGHISDILLIRYLHDDM